MKISNKIYLISIFFFIFLMLLIAFIARVYYVSEQAMNKAKTVNETLVGLFELNVVTNDYLLHREDRALEQWNLKYDFLMKGFISHGRNEANFNHTHTEEEKKILNEMELEFLDIGNIFKKISSDNISGNLEDVLVGQLSAKMQLMINDAFSIFNESNKGVENAKNLIFIVFFIFLAILFIIILMVVYIIRNSISIPLAELTNEVDKISQGNLSIKMNDKVIASKDEIGVLANSFLVMTKKLNESYQNLENKVKQRTFDLDRAKAQDDAMLENIGEGLVFVDIQNKIMFLNRASEKLLGIDRNSVIGKDWIEVAQVLDENKQKAKRENLPVVKSLLSSISAPASVSRLFYFTKKNGEIFPVAINASKVILKNKIIGAIDIFRDISIEKEVDKAKTEFVSLVSHELRTPLTGIRWNTEILSKKKAGVLTIKQKRVIKEIQKANMRMLGLINTLLNVSRLEAGTFIVEPKDLNILDLVKVILKEQKLIAKKNGLIIKTNFEKDIPAKMKLDPQLTNMIVQNLLSNAIKYSLSKGTINFDILNIKKDKVYGKNLVKKDSILIIVVDQGMGIPIKEQGNIFSKLYRADNAKLIGIQGTGLGLYITKTIIDNVGGNIWFESEENKGTTFFVSLPISGMKARGGTKKLEK